MLKVTIGITTYNLEKYIAKALDSILMQKTNFDFKILVVDDASLDKTPKILQDYKQKYPDKIDLILKEKNGGSLESSNILFNQLKTEYFSFLDGDDYWLDENRLQKQVDFLDSHPDYTMVGGNTFFLRNGKKQDKVISNKYLGKTFDWQDKKQDRCPFVHTSSILLRNVVYKNGVPQEYICAQDTMDNPVYRGEDIRFLQHLEKGKIHIFPEDFSVYRIHDKGMWSSSSSNKRILEGMIASLKYMDIFPSATEKWTIDFVNLYRSFLIKLTKKYDLSDIENDYLRYVFLLLKTHNIKWNTEEVSKPQRLKDKIRLKIYKKLHKKLAGKGLI